MHLFRKYLLPLFSIFLLAIAPGCKDDNTPDPVPVPTPASQATIAFVNGPLFTNTDQTLLVGTPFRTQLVLRSNVAGKPLKKLQVTVTYGTGTPVTRLDSALTAESLTYTYKGTTNGQPGTERWTFIITDAGNQQVSQSFILTTTPVVAVTPISLSFVSGPGLVSSDTTLTGGSNFTSKVQVNSNIPGIPLKRLTIQVSYDNGLPVTVMDTLLNSENISYVFTNSTRNVSGIERWIYTAIDNTNRSASSSLTLTTTNPNTGPLNIFTAVILGSQSNITRGQYFDTTSGAVMFQSQAAAQQLLVDFVFFYGVTNQATIAAPNDATAQSIYNNPTNGLQTWTVQNATRFKTGGLTSSTYTQVSTPQHLQTAYTTTTGLESSKASQLNVGDIVAFRTAAGKYGLFKVVAAPIANSNSSTITIEIKVEP